MTLNTPIWMQATGGDPQIQYSAQQMRASLRGLVRTDGVLDLVSGALKVTQRGAGANFSVDIAPGIGTVVGDDVTDQGIYLAQSTAAVNLVTPGAPGSGTRVHRVVAQIRDKMHNGAWTTYDWTPVLLPDTGSGTPALPNSAIPLARVSVTVGQTSVTNANITDDRISAALLSGQCPQVASDSARPPNPYISEQIWRTDKTCFEVWSGAAWREQYIGAEGPAWTPYTPTLTAVTTNPTLGTGSVVEGSYQQVGKKVVARANIKWGSTGLAVGSGRYRVSLPVTAKSLATGNHLGSSMCYDNSLDAYWDGICLIGSADYTKVELVSLNNNVSSSGPIPWASSDRIEITITYEAA